jgi:transcriptional regulator with XRE-family HTH domain
MINSGDFTNRLKKLMEHHQLSASTFADKVGVQRSSISHILSGRNKPSLDFVLKVTSEFKDVDIHWLLNGTGVFPIPKVSKEKSTVAAAIGNTNSETSGKQIQRIVVFFTDGTFDEYQK